MDFRSKKQKKNLQINVSNHLLLFKIFLNEKKLLKTIATPCIKPKKTKFQDGPCQIPAIKNTKIVTNDVEKTLT